MPIEIVTRNPLSLHPVTFIINGGGVAIQPGAAGDLVFPWDAEFVRLHFNGRPIDGSMELDILLSAPGDFPDGAVSMVGAGTPPAIANDREVVFEDPGDWDTTHFDAGSVASLVVNSSTNFDFMTITMIVRSL